MTSTNYTGRKIDLALFPDLTQEGVAANARFSNNPKVIAGIAKAVQNFARLLLTPLGHYRSDPDLGSSFLERLRTRQVRYPTDVLHAFSMESARVIAWMRQHYTDDTPADERIKSATLVSQNVSGTTIALEIEIVTEADETLSFLLPVNWTA